MDYHTVVNIARESAGQVLSEANMKMLVQEQIKEQLEPLVKQYMEEYHSEIKENLNIINQQIIILKDAIQAIHERNSK